MSVYLFWFLILFGFVKGIRGSCEAIQHGKPKGNHNAAIGTIDVLLGFLMILFAYEVL